MHDAILIAMNDMVIPLVEMAVWSFTGSSGNGPNSKVQNADRRDFTANTENTPVKSASNRLDSNIEQDEIDETRDIDNSDFPATKFNHDWRVRAHHSSDQSKFSTYGENFWVFKRFFWNWKIILFQRVPI